MPVAAKQEEVQRKLLGALGSVMGAKAALFHGGEVGLEILDAIREDIVGAMEANNQNGPRRREEGR